MKMEINLTAQRELAEKVFAWMQTAKMKQMAHIGAHFKMTANEIRPSVEMLLNEQRINKVVIANRSTYGIHVVSDQVVRARYVIKPLQENRQLSERYAQIKANRVAYPSKF